MTTPTFESFGLSEKTLAVLKKKGFEEPTPIQALAIPPLLGEGGDLVARARTGTGKTAAFGIPLVERLSAPAPRVRALVLVPTRELAIQVHAEIVSLRHGTHPRTVAVYGGQAISVQLRSLERGVDIVVGTPGRVLDMIQRGRLDLSGVEILVLDEADEMLDMGFTEEIDAIFDAVNPERRVLMFSASMPDEVMRVARKRLRNFTTIEDHATTAPTELTEQIWLEVREQDKMEAFTRIVDREEDFYGLVFARTRVDADRIGQTLEERGYAVETLHGDYAQEHRDRVMARFRSGKARILVATDVAARGIDVEGLTHVVNWSLPTGPAGVHAPHRPHGARGERGHGHHLRHANGVPQAHADAPGSGCAHQERHRAQGERRDRRPARPGHHPREHGWRRRGNRGISVDDARRRNPGDNGRADRPRLVPFPCLRRHAGPRPLRPDPGGGARGAPRAARGPGRPDTAVGVRRSKERDRSQGPGGHDPPRLGPARTGSSTASRSSTHSPW